MQHHGRIPEITHPMGSEKHEHRRSLCMWILKYDRNGPMTQKQTYRHREQAAVAKAGRGGVGSGGWVSRCDLLHRRDRLRPPAEHRARYPVACGSRSAKEHEEESVCKPKGVTLLYSRNEPNIVERVHFKEWTRKQFWRLVAQ